MVAAMLPVSLPAVADDRPEPHVHDTPQPADVGELLAGFYLRREAAPALAVGLDLAQGYAAQAHFVRKVRDAFEARKPGSGKIVGYKAALTNPAVQAAFGVKEPLRGVLLAGMLLPSGTSVRADFGGVPLSEGDLLVRVRSGAINRATSRLDVLAALDAVIPFVELPDLVYGKGVKIDGPAGAAINAAARLGIVGEPIPLAASADWERRLGDFTADILDESGKVVATGQGRALLGHPIEAVIWLRDSLRASGTELQTGDLLSLGTVTKLLPVIPGTVVRARYTGLDPGGPVEISVKFHEEPHEL
jgi:2-keto-4-pentenoate hydratase